jgi:hypothetical protein
MGSLYADNRGTDDSGLRQSAELRTELEELEAVNVRLSATVNRLGR